jgi:glutathione S-transferase
VAPRRARLQSTSTTVAPPRIKEPAVTSSTLVLHGTVLSGHTHRVENFLCILGLPYRFAPAPAAVRQSPEFRVLNPLGQIPVLEDGDLVLADSNAILVYLARRYAPGSPWLPDEPVAAARVQRWLSICANEMKNGPAAARVLTVWGGDGDFAAAHALSAKLFAFMESHLASRSFLAGDHATIADISGYSYIARAPEGRISLDEFPHIRAWLTRVEAIPGFRPMPMTSIQQAKATAPPAPAAGSAR